MKTKPPVCSPRNRGGILVIVLVILVAFSLLTLALLNLGKFNAMETANELLRAQARWIAEAGVEEISARIKSNPVFRDNLSSVASSFGPEPLPGGTGSYTVLVRKRPGPRPNENVFEILSTGLVAGPGNEPVLAQVQVVLTGAPGVNQALLGLGGNSTIRANVMVDSPVYVRGHLTLQGGNITITEPVELGGETTTINPSNYEPKQTVDVIVFPSFSTTETYQTYQTLLSQAASGGITTQPYTVQGALGGATVHVNGNVTIGSVTGPGTIVCTGEAQITSPHTVIGSGVRIVSQGNVDFKQQATLREQTEVFTMQDILFRQAGTTTEGTTLIAMGNIVIQQQMDFKGILYSEGTIEVAQNANLEGTLIARDGFEIKSNITVKYNPDVFANPNPLPFFSWVLTTRRQWEQNPLHNILF